jgi:hypothetical protein
MPRQRYDKFNACVGRPECCNLFGLRRSLKVNTEALETATQSIRSYLSSKPLLQCFVEIFASYTFVRRYVPPQKILCFVVNYSMVTLSPPVNETLHTALIKGSLISVKLT